MHKEDIALVRHSLAHLLASAIQKLYPKAQPTIGPAIDTGFYYDFDFSAGETPGENDLAKIEQKMRELVKSWDAFSHKEVNADEARAHFKGNPYKLELIEEIVSKGEKITLYTSGDFTDLCRGGHVHSMKDVDMAGFKLARIAGAYWRGDETKTMLTRIYGFAFASKTELETYETMIAQAKERDHKKLGRELDLFTFSDLVGAGLPLWTPRGTQMRHTLDNYVWELRSKHGYDRVEIPHITKKDLYLTSGHWEKYADDLFKIKTREGHEFAMKPMNCPHHTQIYARRAWSYKELPQRYANTTMCYRDEQSGELSGLSRVRGFAQDDAHVFCRMVQVREEFMKIWNIVHEFYGTFGFALKVRISRHDPAHPENYLGTKENWAHAENVLSEIAREKGAEVIDGIGEAAFYGPKLDFMANDALGRQWQVATIQLDMNMPERFDLTCTNEKGEKERIVMIHAAIMGSIERFMSIMIEHTAGKFPLWLAPDQVCVIPVKETAFEVAQDIYAKLRAHGIRSKIDLTDEGFGKKVRKAKEALVPYWIIIGDKDIAAGKVTLESRDAGQIGQVDASEAIERIVSENKKRA